MRCIRLLSCLMSNIDSLFHSVVAPNKTEYNSLQYPVCQNVFILINEFFRVSTRGHILILLRWYQQNYIRAIDWNKIVTNK